MAEVPDDSAPLPKRSRVISFERPKTPKHVVAVSSCKGGVGKSTVALNLAYSFAQLGHRVGLLDADLCGPSLPTLIGAEANGYKIELSPDGRFVAPIVHEGVACMSFGLIQQELAPLAASRRVDSAAMLNGEVSRIIVEQLIVGTSWGELDYLVIDLPPGTSDIHRTMAHSLPIDVSVIVTTPHRLAVIDVAKGIDMFDRMLIPTAAIVENMAWMDNSRAEAAFSDAHREEIITLKKIQELVEASPGGSEAVALVVKDRLAAISAAQIPDKEVFRTYPFGRSNLHESLASTAERNAKSLHERFNRSSSEKTRGASVLKYHIPFCEEMASDSDVPFVLGYPGLPVAGIYKDLASAMHDCMPQYTAGRTRRTLTARATDWRWIMRFELHTVSMGSMGH
mmetsp:Transcript_92034/g.161056  ORF Transcript_92034/g.161056 Transcript_92034/m.161056 type:complete len:396 (-) Transcript_92034:305-1492(-)